MLSPANLNLVERDAAIPGLALIFDHQRLLSIVKSYSSIPLAEGRMTYIRYKPGVHCLVGHEFVSETGTTAVYAKAFAGESLPKMEKARRRCSAIGPMGFSSVVVDAADVLIHAFPNDAALNALPLLTSVNQRQALLARMLPTIPDLWSSNVHPLRYKMERRYVARLEGKGRQALCKLHTSDFGNANAAAQQIQSTALLHVARHLGHSTADRAIVMEWLEGDSLVTQMQAEKFSAETLQQVGRALADLHRQRAILFNEYTPALEIEAIKAAVTAINVTCPHLIARVAPIARRTSLGLAETKISAMTIHGDFSADQVLLQADGRVSILDLDCAGKGDPMADLGSFAAALYHDVALGLFSEATAHRAISALLEGYISAEGSSFDYGRFRLHSLGRMLRLVISPFRAGRPHWSLEMEALVKQVERLWREY